MFIPILTGKNNMICIKLLSQKLLYYWCHWSLSERLLTLNNIFFGIFFSNIFFIVFQTVYLLWALVYDLHKIDSLMSLIFIRKIRMTYEKHIFFILWNKSQLKSTFLPYRVKSHSKWTHLKSISRYWNIYFWIFFKQVFLKSVYSLWALVSGENNTWLRSVYSNPTKGI